MPKRLLTATLAAAALALAGCTTYTAQTQERDTAVKTGSIDVAVAIADRDAEKHKDDKDAILYRLEQGAVLRQAALAKMAVPAVVEAKPKASEGATAATTPQTETNATAGEAPPTPEQHFLRRSLAAFDKAEERINRYEEEAKVKVGSEIGATLTNQANQPYRGRAYDKILMNAYKALNYVQLGDRDAARVELNRALQRQRDAVSENAKRIEEAQKEADEARAGRARNEKGQPASYDVDRARADSRTGPALAQVEAELNARMKPYGDYVNPFVVFLDGVFFAANAEGNADLERARKSLERVSQLAPENPYAREDAAMAEAAANGQLPSNLTYVVFEAGSAPYRDQIRIDIPTFVVTSQLSYVGAALPKLKYNDDYTPTLTVLTGDKSLNTATLASMDSVVSLDFKNEWPSIVTRTLISTAVKAAIDATIQKQAKDQFGWGGQLLAMAASAAVQAAVNIADTRTWRSLPKEFQYARLETPADRKITVVAGNRTEVVEVGPGSINMVYVKSLNPTSPLLVSTFALKP